MGEANGRTSDSWDVPLIELFDHKIVRLLHESDIAGLGSAESAALLYDEMRSFMALKQAIHAADPPETLRPLNEALLQFAARLFTAAHQVLLNDGRRGKGAEPHQPTNSHHRTMVQTSQFLLEWQVVQLRSARQRLILELADVSQRNRDLYRTLPLPESISAEVEDARVRISNIWNDLPEIVWDPGRREDEQRHLAA